jgi:hypothetical protein
MKEEQGLLIQQIKSMDAAAAGIIIKCDQQTHEKCCFQLWHQSEENYPTMSHNNSANFPCWVIPL